MMISFNDQSLSSITTNILFNLTYPMGEKLESPLKSEEKRESSEEVKGEFPEGDDFSFQGERGEESSRRSDHKLNKDSSYQNGVQEPPFDNAEESPILWSEADQL